MTWLKGERVDIYSHADKISLHRHLLHETRQVLIHQPYTHLSLLIILLKMLFSKSYRHREYAFPYLLKNISLPLTQSLLMGHHVIDYNVVRSI